MNAAAFTPQDLSRAYILSTYLAQGGVAASVELIVDPNAGHTTARVASETLLLARDAAGDYVVTSAALTSQLSDESAGPHVVQVSSSTAGGVTTLQVRFDSDLDANSIAAAISVLSTSGATLPSTATYNPDTRTATVTIANAPAGTLTLDIATTLSRTSKGRIWRAASQPRSRRAPNRASPIPAGTGSPAPGCASSHQRPCTVPAHAGMRCALQ